jgi:3-oxoacyl-[acyl-carrier protein] reductase
VASLSYFSRAGMPQEPDPPANFTSDESDDYGAQAGSRSPEAVVEELLEEVTPETQPAPLLNVGGLRGRVALVTGGSRGIGKAIAIELAASGVNIAFNFLDAGADSRREAHEAQAELEATGIQVFCRACDVRDSEGVRAFVEEAVQEMGGLHILVNNAGIGRDRALWHMSDEEWQSVLDTNLSGAFYFIRAVTPHFRAQEWGKIINVASIHGVRGEFGLVNYISSKAGMIGLTRSAAVELGPSNVNVNAVAPGYIRTTRLTDQVPAEIIDRARDKSLLGRLGDPQDVARVVLFLSSEAARHITGAVIPVDGGYFL